MALVGNALPDAAAALQRAGVSLGTREIIDRLTGEVHGRGAPRTSQWRPGALELLEELHQANIPCGLVTMSEEPLAALVLRAAAEAPTSTSASPGNGRARQAAPRPVPAGPGDARRTRVRA